MICFIVLYNFILITVKLYDRLYMGIAERTCLLTMGLLQWSKCLQMARVLEMVRQRLSEDGILLGLHVCSYQNVTLIDSNRLYHRLKLFC